MDRRNFFLLAGATTFALTAEDSAEAAMSGTSDRGLKGLMHATQIFAGSSLDAEFVRMGRETAKIRNGHGGNAADDVDVLCGAWFVLVHIGTQAARVTDPLKEFGRYFADFPLSKMVDTVARSKFGGNNMAITFNRDGELQVSH